MNLKKFFIAILLASALLAPLASSAAILDTSLIAEAQNCGAQGSACSLNTFVKLGVNVANFILGIVGALTLLMFVYGGVTWIISGGSADKVKKGKDIIIGSVVGLMIVFGSYLIINFVVNDILGAQGDYKFTGSIKNETTTQNKVGALCESILSGYCISGAGICASDEQSIGESDCGKSNVCCRKVAQSRCVSEFHGVCSPNLQTCQVIPNSANACPTSGDFCCSPVVQQTCEPPRGFCTASGVCRSFNCGGIIKNFTGCSLGRECCSQPCL